MRKFILHTKAGKSVISEVEIEIITGTEDSSVVSLPVGEYKARIMKPTSLYERVEKLVNSKKVFVDVPPIWFNFAFYSSLEEAKVECEKLIQKEFDFKLRKYGTQFSEEELQEALSNIEINLLGS